MLGFSFTLSLEKQVNSMANSAATRGRFGTNNLSCNYYLKYPTFLFCKPSKLRGIHTRKALKYTEKRAEISELAAIMNVNQR